MSMPKCETCKYYRPHAIVKMEGECNDSSKIIFVNDVAQNDRPNVFEFSWCVSHEAIKS